MAFSKGAIAIFLISIALAQPFTAVAQPDGFGNTNTVASQNSDGADNGNLAAQQNSNPNANGNAGNNNGRPQKQGKSGGDPLIQAFDGSLFFFHGEPGKIYNLASVSDGFKVNALLKEANNAVHIGSDKNGTYMQAIGFQQDNVKVSAETYADDSSRMIVKINGQALHLSDASATRTLGAITVTFKNFEAKMGTVLTIRSPHVNIGINLVPPGLDQAGYWQPSYLNIEFTLLAAPTATLQGVIGDTFHFRSQAMSAASVDANDKVAKIVAYTALVYPVFPDMTYEVPTLFSAPQMTFTAKFIHEVIMMRKAAVSKLAPIYSIA